MTTSLRWVRFCLLTVWSITSVVRDVLPFVVHIIVTARLRRRWTKTNNGSTATFVVFTKTPSD